MNFDSVLIVTYGRSGSTLLQGLLNAMDGCLVRGENHNACYHLFRAYQALIESRREIELAKSDGLSVTNPWFGATLLDPELYLSRISTLVREQLMGDEDASRVQCLGFKEIRYPGLPALTEYLNFLERIFPRAAFVFLTRDHKSVAKSAWWQSRDPSTVDSELTEFENDVLKWGVNRQNLFHIDYENLSAHGDRVPALFEFLGAAYDRQVVDAVLAKPHSYATHGEAAGRGGMPAAAEPDEQPMQRAAWLDVSLRADPNIVLAFFDELPGRPLPGSVVSLGGVVLAGDAAPQKWLRLKRQDGSADAVSWGMPSPAVGAQFPANPLAGMSRFSIENLGRSSGTYELLLSGDNCPDVLVATIQVAL